MSDFNGLRTALSALYAQRRGLEITGQNVANANTKGYSRQRVELTNIGAAESASMYTRVMSPGQGVRIADIARYRDQFLELRALMEHSAESRLVESNATLARIEDVFGEPSDIGVSQHLSDFWAGFDDVANHPGDVASRSQLLERAATLATTLNEKSDALASMQANSTAKLNAAINNVNTIASTLAEMNNTIKTASLAGLNVNDLLDERDRLVGQLTDLVGGTARYGENGQVDVLVGGTGLVMGATTTSLMVQTSPSPVSVRWATDSSPARVTGGSAAGLLDVINTTIPGYRSNLDAVATQLRDDVNAVHGRVAGAIPAAGSDLSGAGTLSFDIGLDGGAFTTASLSGADWSGPGGAAALQTALQAAFDGSVGAGNATVTVTGGNGSPLSVSVAAVSPHVVQVRANGTNTGLTTLLGTTAVGRDGVGGRPFFTGVDASTIAVSSYMSNGAVAAGTAAGGPLDGSVALDLGEMHSAATGPDAQFRSLITALGVDAQNTKHRTEIQAAAVQEIDSSRSAYSGVNIDEEMTNMVQFQHAYDAAARFMTAIDQMLDTLIHGTGLAGR